MDDTGEQPDADFFAGPMRYSMAGTGPLPEGALEHMMQKPSPQSIQALRDLGVDISHIFVEHDPYYERPAAADPTDEDGVCLACGYPLAQSADGLCDLHAEPDPEARPPMQWGE